MNSRQKNRWIQKIQRVIMGSQLAAVAATVIQLWHMR